MRAGSAPGPGRPLGPGQRPVWRPRRRAARDSAAFPGASGPPKALESAEIGATRGDSKPRTPAARAWAGGLKIWARKEQTSSIPFETSAPRVRIVFVANVLSGAVGPGSVLSFSTLVRGLQPAPAPEGADGRRPQPWERSLSRAGSRRLLGDPLSHPHPTPPPGGGQQPRPRGPLVLLREGRDADPGQSPSRR